MTAQTKNAEQGQFGYKNLSLPQKCWVSDGQKPSKQLPFVLNSGKVPEALIYCPHITCHFPDHIHPISLRDQQQQSEASALSPFDQFPHSCPINSIRQPRALAYGDLNSPGVSSLSVLMLFIDGSGSWLARQPGDFFCLCLLSSKHVLSHWLRGEAGWPLSSKPDGRFWKSHN